MNTEMQNSGMAENVFEGVDNDELARRICDIDKALQNYSEGEESNLKRGEIRESLFAELEKRMGGDTAAATGLVEKMQSETEDLEQAA